AAGCTATGHLGYAYVDAECSGNGGIKSNMCSGATYATLVAPPGYTNYQWYDPSNNLLVGATNDTLQVSSTTMGSTFSCSMTLSNGCSVTQSVVVANSVVGITALNSTGSCVNGTSGSVFVG